MPNSTSFPFLNLPILVQLLIVKCLSLPDFLMFSLMSQSAKGIAKREKMSIETFQWEIRADETCQLQLTHQLFYIVFSKDVVTVYKTQNELSEKRTKVSIHPEVLSKHVMEVFNITNFKLSSQVYKNLEDFWVFQLVENWEKVIINDLNWNPIDVETLKFCLTLKTRELQLRCKVEDEVKWSKDFGILKMEIFLMCDSKWMTLDALLSAECKEIILTFPNSILSDSDFNTFIKHWKSGGLKNLEKLQVTLGGKTDGRLDKILEGIETLDPGPRHEQDHSVQIRGRDIQRSDGVLANAVIYNIGIFHFLVKPSIRFDLRV